MRYLVLMILILQHLAPYAQRRPNILVIVSDDHAYQTIGAYGNKVARTPNIDRIAATGVTFRKAFVTNSICGPSRAVLLTGKYSHKNGFKDNETSRFDSSQNTFIKELKAAGYQTAWIGKWHLGSTPTGFDHWQVLPGQGQYYNPDFLTMDGTTKRIEGYATTIIEDISEQWLNDRDTTKPFCLVIGHKAAHRTWVPDTSDFRLFDSVRFPLPENFYDDYTNREAAARQDMSIAKTMLLGYDLKMQSFSSTEEVAVSRMNSAQRKAFDAYYKPIEEEFRRLNLTGKALTEWKYQRYMRDYLATAASLDRNIGRALDYLDNNGLTSNTIVVYISDQGFFMGEHGWFDKRFMYEESFRTPFIMSYPKLIKPGTLSDELVLNLDVAPTLLAAAGVVVPRDMQGRALLNRRTLEDKIRDVVYYHYYENGEHAVSPHFGVRTRRYKLIRFYKRVESWELYDLHNDPSEMNNLFDKPGYEKIISSLKKELANQAAHFEDKEALTLIRNSR